jgi:transposase InsO family protein
MGQAIAMKIRSKQRQELEEIVARPSAPAGLVRRARVVLLSAEGVSGAEIAVRLDLSPEHVSRIRKRFRTEGVPRLARNQGVRTTRFRARRSRGSLEGIDDFESRVGAELSIGNYIDGFYNIQRRHSVINYNSPVEFELIHSVQRAAA